MSMTKDQVRSTEEALRLALEALEDLGNHDRVCPQWPTYAEPENYPKCNCGYDQAITAIKVALGAKDEPVAWRDAAIRLGEELSSVGPDGYYDMDAKEWLDWTMEQNPRGKHSLHKRTWVGLMDEDRFELAKAQHGWEDLCLAVEAKLKEKNT